MKYIVCNSETAVLNRMYDEFEKHLEDGAVISLPEQIVGTQFANRMLEDCKNKKYSYKHVIVVGQREFTGIDIEEDFGLYRYMRRELYRNLDIDWKNIYYPQNLQEQSIEESLANYSEVLQDNRADVAIAFLGADGTILDYKEATEENSNIHAIYFSQENVALLEKSGMKLRDNRLISIGYENLLEAKNLFLVVLGSDKRKYIEEMFEHSEDENNKNILSLLNEHKNIIIFTDKEASYKSEEEVNRLIRQRKKQKERENYSKEQ